MRRRSQPRQTKSGRRFVSPGFCFWAALRGDISAGLASLALFSALAASGCDLFDPAKTENPIFGPPPPRNKVTASTKSTGDASASSPGSSTQTVENAQGAQESPSGADISQATTRGAAPLEGDIKRASFTGHIPGPSTKLSGNELAAMVNNQPIFVSEILERAYTERLPPEGLSLIVANQNLASGSVTEREFRALQETAIRQYLKEYVRTRVLCQALESKLEKEQKDKIEEAIGKMFDEYVEKIKKDMKAASRLEVEQTLHKQGTSLAGLKVEFRYRLLADEYVRQKSKKPHVVGRREVLAYYEDHLADYSFPEKVHWQLLEISVAKHGGQAQALNVLEKAVDALRRGEDFAKVAKKYSDGPQADNGGQQAWIKPDSVADAKTAAVLRSLAPGEVSAVIHTKESYRLIRLNQRKPAGRSPLAEVQETIRQKIEDKLQKEATHEVLVDAYKHASIESAFLSPAELGPAMVLCRIS